MSQAGVKMPEVGGKDDRNGGRDTRGDVEITLRQDARVWGRS
jgi:hypothetical protein